MSAVFRKLQELDGLVTEGASVSAHGEEQGRKNPALGGSDADGLVFRDMFPQLHVLLPVRQAVCDPPAGGVRHVELGELVLKQSWEDSVECSVEVNKQDPGICSWRVQMLEGVFSIQNGVSPPS